MRTQPDLLPFEVERLIWKDEGPKSLIHEWARRWEKLTGGWRLKLEAVGRVDKSRIEIDQRFKDGVPPAVVVEITKHTLIQFESAFRSQTEEE